MTLLEKVAGDLAVVETNLVEAKNLYEARVAELIQKRERLTRTQQVLKAAQTAGVLRALADAGIEVRF